MIPLKVVIAGGEGAGKSTLVRSASDIVPIVSEIDYPLAVDFGRLTVGTDLVVYLFGLPGDRRFSFMRDALCRGSHCAVVLTDARRLEDSFESIDYFETRRIPFALAVNSFGGAPLHSLDEVREALSLPPDSAVLHLDVREREATAALLRDLAERSIDLVC